MEKQYIKAFLEKSGDKLLFIASDETKDRHGDSLPVESWDLRNYRKAPRLLVDHDHRVEKIVGKAKGIKIEKANKKRLVFEAVLHEITELSKQVKEMIVGGFLDTVSVGFIPHDEETKDAEGKALKSYRNELVEISFVTVPANPNANQIKSLMEKDEKVDEKKIEDFVQGEKKVEKKKDEVMSVNTGVAGMDVDIKYVDSNDDNSDEHLELNGGEKHLDTHCVNEKGRSFSISERKAIVMRRGLKEAVKQINFALNQANKIGKKQ